MADDRNDHPSNAQTHSFGAGKDDLFGWLVGRAAADLGLAQAIAASEARRNEQLKRLEESLLTQVQELKKQQGAAGDPALTLAGIDDLKVEIRNFAERMGWLESASQQTHHLSGALKEEIALVENHIADQESRIESADANLVRLDQSISAKVRELEQQLGAASNAPDSLTGEIGEVRSQLQALVERVTGCELLTGTVLTRAELEAERWRWAAEVDERVMTRIRELDDEVVGKLNTIGAIKLDQEAGAAELARLVQRLADIDAAAHQVAGELKAEVGAHREASRSRDGERKASEKLLREQLNGVEQKLTAVESGLRERSENAAASHQRELDGLIARMEALSKSVNDKDATRGAEQMGWKKDVEELLAVRLATIEDSLNELRRPDEGQFANGRDLKLEMSALVERLAKAEFSAQQAQAISAVESQRVEQSAGALKMELTSFRAEVTEQFRRFQAPEAALTALEERFALKCDEMHSRIAQTRQQNESHDQHLQQLSSDLQTVLRRVSEAEGDAHQTRALMVHEREQNAQQRGGLRSEHEALREQLNADHADREHDTAIPDLEQNFRRQIGELENQLSERLRLLEQRDGDFRQFTAPAQTLGQPSLHAEISTPVFPAAALSPPVARFVDINAFRAQPEASIRPNAPSVDKPPQDAAANVLESPLSNGILNSGSRDQLKLLQERISADIERARNELREKSGRWKVRR